MNIFLYVYTIMSRNLYFVFYSDNDYMSDRLQLLFNRINPPGLWKYINVYSDEILDMIPLQLESLPCVYDVKKQALYEGEYIFQYLSKLDRYKYKNMKKQINQDIQQYHESDVDNSMTYQTRRETVEELNKYYGNDQENFNPIQHDVVNREGDTQDDVDEFYNY